MKLIRIILFISSLIGIASCNEIFEKPVEDEEMIINMPADGSSSTSFTQTFWWESVAGASNYRIQIVSPSFADIKSITVDSILTSTKFKIALDSGNYEWMVWAFNNTSNNKGKVKPRSLSILPGSLIEQPALEIEDPEAGAYKKDTIITFKWKSLPISNIRYKIQIGHAPFKEDDLLKEDVFEGNSYTYTFKVNKTETFTWKVRAQSPSGDDFNPWAGPFSFTIDTEIPAKVDPSSPAKGALLAKGDITLRWNKVTDISKYNLYMYKSDSTTLYSNDFPKEISGENYEFELGSSGEKIYWQVSAIDNARNEGPKSDKWNFTVK